MGFFVLLIYYSWILNLTFSTYIYEKHNPYFLKTNGSALASPSTLTNKLNKKADALCNGKGYEKLSDDLSLKKSTAYTT